MISLKKLSTVLLVILLCLSILVSCSKPLVNGNLSDSSESSGITSSSTAATSTQTPSETESDNGGETSSQTPTTGTQTDVPETSSPVTIPPNTSETTGPSTESTSKPIETDPPVTSTTTPPVTTTPTTTPSTDEPAYIPSAKLTVSFHSYASVNEPRPYLKGEAIYSILYGGSRAQVGDTLVFNLAVSPVDHGDMILVSATDNLSCTISSNRLTVTVNSMNDISTGRITIYTAKDDRSPINASVKISFVIDDAKDPYEDMFSLIGHYITAKGMSNTDVAHGYTTEDPSLSITGFEGAPAWDDQILKTEPDWKKKCLWLIDQYAAFGFTKVSFIEATTSFGFSASK